MKWRWLFIQLIYKSQIASMEKYWYNLNSKSSGFWLVHLCHISNYDNNCIYKHLECLQFILVGWLCKIDKFIIHLLKMTFFNKIVWLVFIWPFKMLLLCLFPSFFYLSHINITPNWTLLSIFNSFYEQTLWTSSSSLSLIFIISFFHDKDIKVFYDKLSVMEINRY